MLEVPTTTQEEAAAVCSMGTGLYNCEWECETPETTTPLIPKFSRQQLQSKSTTELQQIKSKLQNLSFCLKST